MPPLSDGVFHKSHTETQNGESKDSLSKHVELPVLWEHTVTKALGHHLVSGHIYDYAFDKDKTSGEVSSEERPETLMV